MDTTPFSTRLQLPSAIPAQGLCVLSSLLLSLLLLLLVLVDPGGMR